MAVLMKKMGLMHMAYNGPYELTQDDLESLSKRIDEFEDENLNKFKEVLNTKKCILNIGFLTFKTKNGHYLAVPSAFVINPKFQSELEQIKLDKQKNEKITYEWTHV